MNTLREKLEAIHLRTLRQMRVARGCRAGAMWLGFVWACAMVDAGWSLIGNLTVDDPYTIVELHQTARFTLGLLVLLGAAIALWYARLPKAVRQRDLTHYARHCEAQGNHPPGTLVNAIALEHCKATPLAAALSQRAKAQGDRVAEAIDPVEGVGRYGERRFTAWLLIFLTVWLLTIFGGKAVTAHWVGMQNVARLLDPRGDHPPVAWRSITVKVQQHDTNVTVMPAMQHRRSSMRVRLDDGTTLRIDTTSPGDPSITLRDVRTPITFVVEGEHARSRWQTVTPQVLPKVLSVSLAVQLPESDTRNPWPSDQTVIAPAGSRLHISVQADPSDASLEHPEAMGNSLTLPVSQGDHEHELFLMSSNGLRSREPIIITTRGLTQAQMGELVDGDAAPTQQAPLDTGIPFNPTTRDGTSKPEDAANDRTASGTTGDEGEGSDNAIDDHPMATELARGMLHEQLLRVQLDRPNVQRFADQAPPAYREQVARYFLRITRDAGKERAPSDN